MGAGTLKPNYTLKSYGSRYTQAKLYIKELWEQVHSSQIIH